MPYFIAIAGEKRGPYPAYRVIDQLRSGEISPDALGWEQGMASWRPLREIAAFAETVTALENPPPAPAESADPRRGAGSAPAPAPTWAPASLPRKAEAAPATGLAALAQTRPFSRFAGRMFDYLLVMAVAWQFCEVPPLPKDISPWDLMKNDGTIISQEALMRMAGIHYLALVVWIFVEAVLIHRWGTTPGKALLGIRVTAGDGGLLPLMPSLGRAFVVWMAGFGFGLTPFNLIGSAVGLGMVLFGGGTLWDRMFGARVPVSAMTPRRFLVAVAGFFLLLMLSSWKFS